MNIFFALSKSKCFGWKDMSIFIRKPNLQIISYSFSSALSKKTNYLKLNNQLTFHGKKVEKKVV